MKRSALLGKRVIVTRSAEQAGELSRLLKKKGAVPIEIPTIAFVPLEYGSPVDRSIANLNDYQLLIFTSQNAVRFFGERLRKKGIFKIPNKVEVATVGEKTARALEALGVCDPIVPRAPVAAEELISTLCERHASLEGLKVLFPRAEKGRETLPEALREKGAHVEVVTVYRTIVVQEGKEKLRGLMKGDNVDWITFASPSAVEGFFALSDGKNLLEWIRSTGVRTAAIGRVTAKALEERRISVDAEPKTPTLQAMVEAMALLG